MKLKDVCKILEAESVWKIDSSRSGSREVTSCQASDLISDILSFRGPDSLLLTGLTNVQVIRAAELLDFVAICFVRGKQPQPEAVKLAEDKGIPLLATPLLMYEACGRLYAAGLPAGTRKEGVPIA
ncbi:hypothetical protein KAT59_08505 [Candidatus Bipolaricaulota bacterium]|jgi:hypothetical protein|nr:hypothetical protein [Candidatus Bipolaricaulota bacterium]MCK4683049.1 hypothetical protein [Candidatus Bipolaricaulota bacterium]